MCWKGPLNPSGPEGNEAFPEAAQGVKANPTHQQHPIPPETFCWGAGCSGPALACGGLHPHLSSQGGSVPLGVLVSHKPPGMFRLNLSLESMLVMMEEAWASLQALGPSLSQGARPSWWLLYLGKVLLS